MITPDTPEENSDDAQEDLPEESEVSKKNKESSDFLENGAGEPQEDSEGLFTGLEGRGARSSEKPPAQKGDDSKKGASSKTGRRVPKMVRPLFEMGTETPAPVEADQEMDDPAGEARRVAKRLAAIVEDHRQAAKPLKIELSSTDIKLVIGSLKQHARGAKGLPVPGARDEIHGYCLNRLFEELVEEPSNILFTTKKGPDVVRYDAMNASFWIECLELFEVMYCYKD